MIEGVGDADLTTVLRERDEDELRSSWWRTGFSDVLAVNEWVFVSWVEEPVDKTRAVQRICAMGVHPVSGEMTAKRCTEPRRYEGPGGPWSLRMSVESSSLALDFGPVAQGHPSSEPWSISEELDVGPIRATRARYETIDCDDVRAQVSEPGEEPARPRRVLRRPLTRKRKEP